MEEEDVQKTNKKVLKYFKIYHKKVMPEQWQAMVKNLFMEFQEY